jgi:hypothetical protein
MTKKAKNTGTERAHKLVVFKTAEEIQSKPIEEFSFETVDQEDKIILGTMFTPFGGHYRYSILLDNSSFAPISDVKIKVSYPEFLTLERCRGAIIHLPDVTKVKESKQIILELDELNEKSIKNIHLHFSPISLNNDGEIRTVVTYVNNKDFVRVLTSDPAIIYVSKITIEPKIIPTSYIGEFSKSPGIKKAIKSLGIGAKKKIKPGFYFNILEQLFSIHNMQLIARDPNKMILWFFGYELESKEDILAIGQIVSNKVEIIATSRNQHLLISFMTMLSDDFKERLLFDGIVNEKNEIFNLECKYCGAVLPYFPKKGKSIECKNCNYEQDLW